MSMCRIGWRAAATLALVAVVACGRGPAVRVTVPNGASLRVAADSLARTGVIRSARLFRVFASLKHDDRSIKAGTYILHRGASWSSILDALHGGKGLVSTVTVPEGFAVSQIEPLLAARLLVPVESVDVAVRDTALLHELDVPTPTL